MLLTAEEARRITDRLLGMVKAADAAVGVTSQMHSNLRFSANTLQTSGRIDTVTARMTVWSMAPQVTTVRSVPSCTTRASPSGKASSRSPRGPRR